MTTTSSLQQEVGIHSNAQQLEKKTTTCELVKLAKSSLHRGGLMIRIPASGFGGRLKAKSNCGVSCHLITLPEAADGVYARSDRR